jgi:hypothetical protein
MYFPYFLFVSSLFLNISWLISYIFSALLLQDCTLNYEDCDTVIALTVFGFLELIVWTSVVFLILYYLKNSLISSQSTMQQSTFPEITMREVDRMETQIHHPPSVESQRAEVLEMEEVTL